MPPKARPSDKSASCAPGHYQILSRPSSSGTPIAPTLPDLSEFKVSRNAPIMASAVNTLGAPLTPQRPKSMQSLSPHTLHQRASPFPEDKPKGPVTQSHSHTKATLSPPTQRTLSDTPRRRPKSQTPSKSSSTSSQAYAGPLFHASPAASALPIPKWFTKTTDERKELLETNDLMTVVQIDESPTLRKFRADAKQFPDEPPPKYQMSTDQVEKGKRCDGNTIPTPRDEESVITSWLSASTCVASSPSPDSDGCHPRHPTTHSSKELFPSEIKDAIDSGPKPGSQLERSLSESTRPSSAPSHISAPNMDDEEHRKARSLALKKLLQTPVPQRPLSSSSHLQIAATKDGSRPFLPGRNSSGPSASMASRATKLPYRPDYSNLPSSSPHNDTQEQLKIAQQSQKTATQHILTHHAPYTFDKPKKDCDFDDCRILYSRDENWPLSYGDRAILVEESHRQGSSFKSRPYPTPSQSSRDIDRGSLTNDDRAKQSEDHVEHDGSTCSCKLPISPQQSSSNVERATLQDDSRSSQTKDSLPGGSSFKLRPAISSPQSYPGTESTSVEHYDPKKWLDNHLRHEILKIGTLVSDSATGLTT